jgi:hypothetical protein
MTKGSSNQATPRDAIVMLKANHQRMQGLFQAYEAVTDPSVKREGTEEACTELEIRAQLEKHIFSSPVNEEIDSKRKAMNKQEALADILERAKNEVLSIFLDHPIEFKRWKPTNRGQYFLILGDGEIKSFQWNETSFDQEAWYFGNCFRSRKEAERARYGMKEYLANFHNGYGKGD